MPSGQDSRLSLLLDSIPGQETEILEAVWVQPKKKKGGKIENFMLFVFYHIFLKKVLIIKAHFIDLCYRNGLNAAEFLPSYTVIISNIAFSLMVSLAYGHNEGWWKGMKQFLPAKSVEHEETPVRYSSSEVNHLSPREVTTMLQTDSAGNYSTARAQGETAVLAAKCFGIYSIFYLFHV